MYTPNYLCDLHCHTKRSDGNDTTKELIDIAAQLGMKIIAITDHDVVPDEWIDVDGSMLDPVEYAASKGLGLIPGIEYSCDTDVDDVHIVGLGCNWNHKDIKIEEENMKKSKINGYRRLTEILTENGIHISWEEILENGGNPLKPEEVQRKHIFEMIAKKGYADSWQKAKILVRDNPAYNVKRQKIDPVRAIQIIHNAGGVAILAHPYLIDEKVQKGSRVLTREEYIQNLISNGLDGIEAAYTYNKTSYKGTMTNEAIEKEVREKYQSILKIISGGSDYHNDGKKGVTNPRMIGEKGITFEYFLNNKLLRGLIKKDLLLEGNR